jgi:hypothetical protein
VIPHLRDYHDQTTARSQVWFPQTDQKPLTYRVCGPLPMLPGSRAYPPGRQLLQRGVGIRRWDGTYDLHFLRFYFSNYPNFSQHSAAGYSVQ